MGKNPGALQDDGADRSVSSSLSRRRRAAALGSVHGHGGIRVRVPAAGKKGGGEGEQVEGVLLILHGREGTRGCVGDEGETLGRYSHGRYRVKTMTIF